MKICYIGGANSIHLQRWIKWIVNAGHDVHLITEYPLKINDTKIYLLKYKKEGGFINFLSKMRQTKKFLNKINPDILHAHYVFGYGIFGAYSNFHPYVLTAWGSDILVDTASLIGKSAVKYALKKADLITCEGDNIKERMTKLGVDSKKINKIYFGVDTKKFNSKQRNENIKKNLLIFNSPIIISSKPLESIYDIDSLIKSVPIVLKKIPSAKFVIASNGSQKIKLEQLAKSLNVSENIKFIGFISNEEIPRYLASSDIYVNTSLSDGGLAVATKEAMACELPVIVTNLDVNTKWIEDGKNGFVVPLKDPKTLADKIIYLIEHKDVRKNFGKKGRKLVEEKFEYEKEMKKVENIYEQLINNHKRVK